jgi:hypothetical protein
MPRRKGQREIDTLGAVFFDLYSTERLTSDAAGHIQPLRYQLNG